MPKHLESGGTSCRWDLPGLRFFFFIRLMFYFFLLLLCLCFIFVFCVFFLQLVINNCLFCEIPSYTRNQNRPKTMLLPAEARTLIQTQGLLIRFLYWTNGFRVCLLLLLVLIMMIVSAIAQKRSPGPGNPYPHRPYMAI